MARPEQDVTLDLDAFESEGSPGPFTFKLRGRKYQMLGVEEMDWEDLIEVMVIANGGGEVTPESIKNCISKLLGEDAATFWSGGIPAFKLNALLERYLKHYGLKLGEAAASSRSSSGTAGRSKRTSRSAA